MEGSNRTYPIKLVFVPKHCQLQNVFLDSALTNTPLASLSSLFVIQSHSFFDSILFLLTIEQYPILFYGLALEIIFINAL